MVDKIRRFRESAVFSVHEGRGWKSVLDACDPSALRRHCTQNRHHSVTGSTLLIWKENHPLCAKVLLRRTALKWKTVLWSAESQSEILFGKLNSTSSSLKRRRTIRLVVSAQFWSLDVWRFGFFFSIYETGSLSLWKGTINAERCIYSNTRSRAHDVFFREGVAYFSKTMPTASTCWSSDTSMASLQKSPGAAVRTLEQQRQTGLLSSGNRLSDRNGRTFLSSMSSSCFSRFPDVYELLNKEEEGSDLTMSNCVLCMTVV